jgi:hypothetical protein
MGHENTLPGLFFLLWIISLKNHFIKMLIKIINLFAKQSFYIKQRAQPITTINSTYESKRLLITTV